MKAAWYPFFVVDYRRKTYHLSLAEDGAYRRLIDEYMLTREPLPDDDGALARILGIPPSDWIAIAPRLRKFFRPRAGRLHHKRCEQEIRAQEIRSKHLSERSKKSASTRKRKNNGLGSSRADVLSCPVVSSPPVEPKIQIKRSELGAARARHDDWPADYREQFWAKYPNKVGKDYALEKLDALRKSGRATWSAVMSGLSYYLAKVDDRPWCNPSTWINQGRWKDDPVLFRKDHDGKRPYATQRRQSNADDFFAGLASVAADLDGHGELAGEPDADLPLGRVNIDAEPAK